MSSREQESTHVTVHIDNQHVPILGRPLEVKVDDRGVERAIRKLRRIMASEGVLREIKRRRHHEKPSVKQKRKLREAERRRKRRARKLRQGGLDREMPRGERGERGEKGERSDRSDRYDRD